MSFVILNRGWRVQASSAQVDWSSSACKQRQGFSFSTIYSVVTISCTALSEKKRNTSTRVSETNGSCFFFFAPSSEQNLQVVFTQESAHHISIKGLASEGYFYSRFNTTSCISIRSSTAQNLTAVENTNTSEKKTLKYL